ncbi:hypothetical protein BpHYR1_000315 [Brachionus plicatilis]|uniref:Uncharacterized protein n=1 Tax=Brachionus plicatilis TaxID=10195 RepID=A0A3M7SHJ7_BRAPC|nr:hypothetical protein BpHYR1_000315 [Brachionus plicatilis]
MEIISYVFGMLIMQVCWDEKWFYRYAKTTIPLKSRIALKTKIKHARISHTSVHKSCSTFTPCCVTLTISILPLPLCTPNAIDCHPDSDLRTEINSVPLSFTIDYLITKPVSVLTAITEANAAEATLTGLSFRVTVLLNVNSVPDLRALSFWYLPRSLPTIVLVGHIKPTNFVNDHVRWLVELGLLAAKRANLVLEYKLFVEDYEPVCE